VHYENPYSSTLILAVPSRPEPVDDNGLTHTSSSATRLPSKGQIAGGLFVNSPINSASFYFLAFGICLALAAWFFCFAASAFTFFCTACLCVAFGDLSPMIRSVRSMTTSVNPEGVGFSYAAIFAYLSQWHQSQRQWRAGLLLADPFATPIKAGYEETGACSRRRCDSSDWLIMM
jgi:hypothetical protein